MIFLDMASIFVSYHFSLNIEFHAYAIVIFMRIVGKINTVCTPYQHIPFDAKFYAEFEFEVKIFIRPRILEQKWVEKFCVGKSQKFVSLNQK